MVRHDVSYVCGATTAPLIYQTIGQTLSAAARQHPDTDALIVCHQGIRLTYAQLDAQVDRVARGLLAVGIKRTDRVGIWSPNNAEWVVTQFATARVGAILVNINPAFRTSELDYALRVVGCRMLILATSFKSSDY